jgi:hypothetical protein
MRSGFTWLSALTAAAIAFGACGGEPQKLTTFKLGPDGRPMMGTARETVVLDRRELLTTGVAYTWDCYQDVTLFGGETKVYEAFNGGGRCRGFGAGYHDYMGISAPEWTWPGSSTPINDIYMQLSQAYNSAGTHHVHHCFYQNAEMGTVAIRHPNPSLACWDGLAPHTVLLNNLVSVTKSFEMKRYCTADEQFGSQC